MNRKLQLVKKGLENPRGALIYLIRRIEPEFGRDWTEKYGVYTWDSYEWGDVEPPEISAVNYHVFKQLQGLLSDRDIATGLEVGCGYGRITPYVDELCDKTCAIEPNAEMLEKARNYYPEIDFRKARAQDLPFEDERFELVFTRSVLQHIPEDSIEKAVKELSRVLKKDGLLLIFEDTSGVSASEAYNIRSVEKYKQLFGGLELMETKDVGLPWVETRNQKSAMLFQK